MDKKTAERSPRPAVNDCQVDAGLALVHTRETVDAFLARGGRIKYGPTISPSRVYPRYLKNKRAKYDVYVDQ